MPTKIEYADEVWNVVTGCSKISEGCRHCWAERMSKRLAGRFGYPDAPHNFDVTLHPDKLVQPLYWKKPRRVFVASMGDLFHEDVPFEYIDRVLCIIARCHRDSFMMLTKRPKRMAAYFEDGSFRPGVKGTCLSGGWPKQSKPLPNLWLGVSAEDQEQWNRRVPILSQIPAAVHFVSVEPMLGLVDLQLIRTEPCTHSGCFSHVSHPCEGCGYQGGRLPLDWIICGAETGPGARPMDLGWARSLRDQCQFANVPFFFKRDSNSSRLLDSREWNEYPKVRQ